MWGSLAKKPDGPIYSPKANSPTGGFSTPTPQADPGGYFPTPPQPQTPEAPLAGPGYNENFYKQHGQDLMTPSASEDLYSKGAAGSNPFYDYAQGQTIKAINDASAARGDFNSSFTEKNIGNAVADLRGQQAHELGQLAGQADQSKQARYSDTQSYAKSAQDAMEGRAKGGIAAEDAVAGGRAGLVNGFYSTGGQETQQAMMARIEVLMKQAGFDQAAVDKYMNFVMGSGGNVIKAVASK